MNLCCNVITAIYCYLKSSSKKSTTAILNVLLIILFWIASKDVYAISVKQK